LVTDHQQIIYDYLKGWFTVDFLSRCLFLSINSDLLMFVVAALTGTLTGFTVGSPLPVFRFSSLSEPSKVLPAAAAAQVASKAAPEKAKPKRQEGLSSAPSSSSN